MSARPYFAFFPGDYLADTMGLSCCEHGVYLLLLAVSWQRGPLPDDMDHLARLAANPPIEALRVILNTYWTLTERGWINARLERERDYILKKSEKARASALARWGDANAMRTHSERNADAMLPISKIYTDYKTPSGTLKLEEKEKIGRAIARFTPPSVEDVRAYAREKGLTLNAHDFVDFYQSKGWLVGKSPMKCWKSAASRWARSNAKPEEPRQRAWR